jgi:hypothetical protein
MTLRSLMRFRPTFSYVGCLDLVMQSHVQGWAAGKGAVPVTVSINDAPGVEITPRIPRPDAQALANDLVSGFTYTFPEPLAADDVVSVRFPNGDHIPGSPSTAHRRRLLQLTDGIDPAATGLEFGPLDRPILSKRRAAVLYVDHASRADLLAKYQHTSDPGVLDRDRIRDIDVVWPGGPLRPLLSEPVAWCIGSHVIEHTPDMVGWLRSIADALVPDGLLNLAVPDKTRTFDRHREVTGLAAFIAAHVEGRTRPTPAQVFDHIAYVDPSGDIHNALAVVRDVEANGKYCDVHCQVFTPKSFLVVMAQLAALDLIPFSLRRFYDTRDGANEFICSLVKSDASPEERADSFGDDHV